MCTGVGFLRFGTGWMGAAGSEGGEKRNRFLRWGVHVVVVAGLGMVIGLWQSAVSHEHKRLHELMAKHSAGVAFELEKTIVQYTLTLERFGHRWSALNGQPLKLFEADATRSMEAREALLSMGIIGATGAIEWKIQKSHDGPDVDGAFPWNTLMREARVAFAESSAPLLHTPPIEGIPPALVVRVPLENRRQLIGVFDWEVLLLPIAAKEFSQDVAVRLLDPKTGSVVFAGGGEWPAEMEGWRKATSLTVNSMPLLLEVVPHTQWVQSQIGLFPWLVLSGGLVLVGGILWSLLSALKSHSRAWDLAHTAEALKQDMHRREQAEAQLQERLLFFQLLLESVEEGIYGLDTNGMTAFVNPAAARMLGYHSRELIGKPMHEAVHHSYQNGTPYSRRQCPMYQTALNGVPHHSDGEVLWRKDGTSFPVAYASIPVLAEGGTCLGSVIVFQDISERKRHERDLQTLLDRNAEQIRQLLGLTTLAEELNIRRSLPDMMQVVAERMREIIGTHFVLAGCRFDDHWYQGKVGESCFTLSWDDDCSSVSIRELGRFPFVDDVQRPLRLTKEELMSGPNRLRDLIALDSHRLPNGCMAVPLSRRNGEVIGGILLADKQEGIFSVSDESLAVQAAQLASAAIAWQCSHEELDRTVLERTQTLENLNARLERELQRCKHYEHDLLCKNRDLENLLYIISHDLKEPLRTIQNFSQMVADCGQARLNAEEMNYLERVIRGGERLMQLLSDIQQMAKVQNLAPPDVPVSLSMLVEKAMQMLSEVIDTTHASVRVADDLPSVAVDPLWGTQAIYNLLANALKFRKLNEPPRIEIAPFAGNEAFPENWGVVVHDRGPGVSPKDRERIFQLFKRAVHRNVPGTGTGLAIVQQVAERHGGHVWVEEREGGGASFFLTFGPQQSYSRKEMHDAGM
jgi:PAS domain S-box-containing protein